MHVLRDLLLILLAAGYTFGAMVTLVLLSKDAGDSVTFFQILFWPITWIAAFLNRD